MPCGLHSAISGILAGGILGFGTADRLLSCPSCSRARPSLRGDFGGWFCFVWVFFGFVLVVGWSFSSLDTCLDMLDRVLVDAFFRLPNAGTYRTLHNSFNGTNTVLRPGESREGEGRKKKFTVFDLDSKMAKQQLQKWKLKFVTELEPLEGASPVCLFGEKD